MALENKRNLYPTELYYPCYSPRVLSHLLQNGFQPHATFLNIKTLKTCYVFEKNNNINECIAEVSNLS